MYVDESAHGVGGGWQVEPEQVQRVRGRGRAGARPTSTRITSEVGELSTPNYAPMLGTSPVGQELAEKFTDRMGSEQGLHGQLTTALARMEEFIASAETQRGAVPAGRRGQLDEAQVRLAHGAAEPTLGERLLPVEVDLLCVFAEVEAPFPLDIPATGVTGIEQRMRFRDAREQLTDRGLADENGPLGVAEDFVFLLRSSTGVLDMVLATEKLDLARRAADAPGRVAAGDPGLSDPDGDDPDEGGDARRGRGRPDEARAEGGARRGPRRSACRAGRSRTRSPR